MMLPTSLPLVTLFRAMIRQRANRCRLVLLLLAGYLGVWMVFGFACRLMIDLTSAPATGAPTSFGYLYS